MVEKQLLLDHVNKVLGRLIEQERVTRRLSQFEVATRSGLSRTYLSDIERGLRNLSVLSLHKIASALELKASELLLRAEAKLDKDHSG